MTFAHFHRSAPRTQLFWVILHGTYLAQRWENEQVVRLYHLADTGRGFFAEVGYDKTLDCTAVLRSFSSPVPLEKYAQGVRLPRE